MYTGLCRKSDLLKYLNSKAINDTLCTPETSPVRHYSMYLCLGSSYMSSFHLVEQSVLYRTGCRWSLELLQLSANLIYSELTSSINIF